MEQNEWVKPSAGSGKTLSAAVAGRRRSQRRALDADVEVDDAVIVHVQFAVVVEVPVEPAGDAQGHVEVDLAVVVDVELSVKVGVPAVGVFHDDGGPVDGLAAIKHGLESANAVDERGVGDAEGGKIAGGGGGDDAVAVPGSVAAPRGDQAGNAVVGAAEPRAHRAVAGEVEQQVVVGQVKLSRA